MKLSQAILLGSTILKARRGMLSTVDGYGCALGMAAKAAGIPITDAVPARSQRGYYYTDAVDYSRNYQLIEEVWPWMRASAPSLPDDQGVTSLTIEIFHRFDARVTLGLETLEEFVDWVASIEPPETCSECRSGRPVNEIQVCQECQP
jgi:hypothetical protein